MPKLFERNENVTVLAVPSTLESVYINFQNSFPNLKKIGSMGNNPNWSNFSFKYGLFKSPDQPREDLPYLIPNGDGTLTLDIPEGARDISEIGDLDFYKKVTVINFPASMENFGDRLTWRFDNLKEIHVHPDHPRFTEEDGVLFSKDKKRSFYVLTKRGEIPTRYLNT
jgi:hypothetical protein